MPSFGITALPDVLVLVLELCMVTSHISFHSSLPVSYELAIVQHCIQESKTGVCEHPYVCVEAGRAQKKVIKNEGGELDLNIVWSGHSGHIHQSVLALPGLTKMKKKAKFNER